MALTPPSIDKRLLELTTKQNWEEIRPKTRQRTRIFRSKTVLFLTAGILLLTILIAVGY
jgi:hypothetical protein